MSLIIMSSIITITAAVYWYLNRHKPLKQILIEAKSTMDMNGAGLAGLIDDWIHFWRNKIELPDVKNKVAVVTGGSRGIGQEIVRQLRKANVDVVVGVRNIESESIKSALYNDKKLHAYQLDLKSLKSVKSFAEEVKRDFPKINYLINNAGIMYGDYSLTEDGYESQFAVNHLSHFYLTHLLLPALKNCGTVEEAARIVNISSCAHFPGTINFEDINMKSHYDTVAAYAQSKLAQVMSTRYINSIMEQENFPVRCYAVHPGMVNTDLFEHSLIHKYLPWAMKLMFKTTTQGATSALYACFNKQIENKGGLYISNCAEGFSNSLSKNKEKQKQLHELSCQLVSINKEAFGK